MEEANCYYFNVCNAFNLSDCDYWSPFKLDSNYQREDIISCAGYIYIVLFPSFNQPPDLYPNNYTLVSPCFPVDPSLKLVYSENDTLLFPEILKSAYSGNSIHFCLAQPTGLYTQAHEEPLIYPNF